MTRKRLIGLAVLAVVLFYAVVVPQLWARRRLLLAAWQYRRPPVALVVPVQDVTARSLQSTWGAARSGGRTHQGADIFSPKGTPVIASTRGVVWKVGTDPLGGNVVTIIGEGGALYYYAHLDSWSPGLRVGQRVQPRTQLGTVGNTGNAKRTPSHLHFGVYPVRRWYIAAVDPVPLLKGDLRALRR